MTVQYLADCREFIPTVARWHHTEWGHLRPGETVEDRAGRFSRYRVLRPIAAVMVAQKIEMISRYVFMLVVFPFDLIGRFQIVFENHRIMLAISKSDRAGADFRFLEVCSLHSK